MKIISDKALLGVAAVSVISQSEKPVSSKSICEQLKVPPRHLETLLQALTRAKIIKGSRGPRGGYQAHATADKITVLSIVEVAESLSTADASSFDSALISKKITPRLEKATRVLRDALSEISLASFA